MNSKSLGHPLYIFRGELDGHVPSGQAADDALKVLRGVQLGGDRGVYLTAKQRAAGRAAQQEQARNRATDLMPTIKELQADGFESLRAIAAALQERGIPTARGGRWSSVQVSRLLEAASPFEANAVALNQPVGGTQRVPPTVLVMSAI
jgi:Recombinase